MRIETARLLLRPLEPDDLDAFAELYADPVATRWIGGTASREEVAAWLAERRSWHDRRGYGMCSVVERASGRVVGRCGLVHWDVEGTDELELGYAVLRPYWGRGFATEAAAAARDFALEQLGRERLVSLVAPGNAPSIRVAERIGMAYERDAVFRGRTVLVYALAV